ncbi:MAG: hypothetical protein K1X42_14930 [Opitutaceae bacterium]|nr:hypothetical protein [Opitutaceae bacterium]
MAYESGMEFKRLCLFDKSCAGLLSEHDVFELELVLMVDPEAGDLTPAQDKQLIQLVRDEFP